MTIVLILLGIIAAFVLALRHAPVLHWAIYTLIICVLWKFTTGNGSWIWALAPGVILGLFSVDAIRRTLVTGPAYKMVKTILPRVSRTEQEALDAGTVGWDADLFSGRPNWDNLLGVRKLTLTKAEQDFLSGPCEEVCEMIDDWKVRDQDADMAPAVWKYLKDKKFLGMLIDESHGGLGFSAQAQSMIVSKIASRSVSAGITVMVPNSLGPGELLEKYGTEAQKKQYLRRLAEGKEVPCFALTGPHAGSDAANMRDVGVVGYGTYKGKKTLGVKLSWDKRYITLAPVATLLGLAFNLYDPENLLGKGEEIGITLALVPANYPGVKIGRRHFPSRSAFMNGPTSGKNIFVPLEFLIGGTDYAGQGWRMLMECLSTGRAISLPAIGTTSIKYALRVTSAYARIRRQFGIPVGLMEGVADPMSRMIKSAYTFEASRALTASMVDEGQKPSVISALLKYRTTEEMRDRINDAMDIQAGRAVQDGPSNYLFAGYATVPVAITVEGANILTRTLITFAQGALRAHPFLFDEVQAAQNPDKKQGLLDFDTAFSGHIKFILGNMSGSFWHAISFGRFAPSPVENRMAKWYRGLYRYTQAFALVGDWTVAYLGGALKRKQMLSGRMADILSDLYLLSATLKRWEDDGRIEEDAPVVDAIAMDTFRSIERHFVEVFNNFPNFVLRNLMRVLVFPLGARAAGASDKENYRLARSILRPSPFRDRLTNGVFVSMDPNDRTGVLEDALIKVVAAEEIETKFIRAIKKGELDRRLDEDAITVAMERGILNDNEAAILRASDAATDAAIAVDDFAFDELGRKPAVKRKTASPAKKTASPAKAPAASAKTASVRKAAAKRPTSSAKKTRTKKTAS